MVEENPVLTPRGQQIAMMVIQGPTNRQIAQELGLAQYTVKNGLVAILRKLNVQNRVQLAARMIQQRAD